MAQLAQLSAPNIYSESGRGNLAVAQVLQTSLFFNALNRYSGFQFGETTNRWRPFSESLSTQARALGGSLTASDYTPENEITDTLFNVGGALDYDVSYEADAKAGSTSFNFENDLTRKLIAWIKGYEALAVSTGTGAESPKNIKSLRAIIGGTNPASLANIPGYSETRVLNAATFSKDSTPKSFNLLSANNKAEDVYRMLMTALGQVENPRFMAIEQSAWAAIASMGFGKQVIDSRQDNIGNMFNYFMGVEVVPLTSTSLPKTEADDTGTPVNETSSIYILSPGENNFSLITNSGLAWWDYNAQQNKESGREKWEIRANWRIENPKSVLRIRNIKS